MSTNLSLIQRYAELLSSINSNTPTQSLPNLATKILPTNPSTPPTPTPGEKALAAVIAGIGLETYKFLYAETQFKRSLDMLMTSQLLINNMKGKLFISDPVYKIHREYSYLISPAAKGFEGALLAIAFHKNIITQSDIDDGVSVGSIYADHSGKPAKAKAYVLKKKDSGVINKIYGDWNMFRNKSLHYDSDFFIEKWQDADKTVSEIYETIKLAYKIFIGQPDNYNP